MADLPSAEREQLHAALRELAADYDCVIIDTGAGIGANSVGFAALGSEILLVTTAEPTSLRDAYAMAKVLHKRAGVDAIRVVTNQVSSEAAGLDVYERLSAIARRFLSLELDYLGCVPWDASVPLALTQGRPYVVSAPHSKASRALETLVNKLVTRRVSSGVVC
jgi:flagellar biosynthesis protein FlhG